MRMKLGVRLGLVLATLGVAGCLRPAVDIPASLQVTLVSSGWFDAGLDNLGRNKLSPSVSFRLTNSTEDTIRYLQLNAVFRRAGEDEEWGTHFVRAFGTEGLAAGQSTIVYRMASTRGYTGEQAWSEMMTHRDFADVEMDLFVKHRGNQWVRLDSVPVDRQLLMQ
jgi:hypothetical protein